MVKKIQGSRPGGTSGTTPVQGTKTVESSKVGNVDQVKGTEKRASTAAVGRKTKKLTREQREQLFQLIEEEADKMFGEKGLPESRKKTVKGAVKMAIEASLVDDSDEDKNDAS